MCPALFTQSSGQHSVLLCVISSVDYEYAATYLFILLLMDIWIVSSFRLF